MTKNIDDLVKVRDEALERLGALDGGRIDEEIESLRRRRVALEHDARKGSILNGGAEQALQVESQLVVIDGALRRLEATRDGLARQRGEAKNAVAAASRNLRQALSERHRERVRKLEREIAKVIEPLFGKAYELEESRRKDAETFGVSVDAAEGGLVSGLKDFAAVAGVTVPQSDAAKASVDAALKRKSATVRDENAVRREKEERRLKVLLRSGEGTPETRRQLQEKLKEVTR